METQEQQTEAPKQEEVKQEEIPVEVQAARYLLTALPAFRNLSEKVTGTQARRVLNALIESPLEKNTPPFTTEEAQELFNLGLVITNAKFILFQASLKDNDITKNIEQQAIDAGAKGITDVIETNSGETEQTKGETNGT